MPNIKLKKGIFTGIAALILLGILFLVLRKSEKPQAWQDDYSQISSLEYDTVFLSMYPIDTYHENDFSYYRGLTVFKASYCIPEFSILEQYMEQIQKSGNLVHTAYLGIRPEMAEPQKLQALFDLYPEIAFEIIVYAPSASYWQNLSEEDYAKTLQAYCSLLSSIPDITRANFYFMASEEWLVNNPANYENELLVTEPIARTIMLHSDYAHEYFVTGKNADTLSHALTELTQKIRTNPETLPDLSDFCLIFFGDSVIGNYTDSTSIPGVVAGLTDATVFNCGYGGNSAAMGIHALISLPGITEAFFLGDLSPLPEDTQVRAGIASYLSDPPENKKLCFVVNYGLNDFFNGYAVSSEDPYDITTYCGAIRTAVNTIRANAPEAQIILCTPTYTPQAYSAEGAEIINESGNTLADFVNAVIALSEELQVDVLDNYAQLGISSQNHEQYLSDQIHPNAACRYLIGNHILRLVR